MEEVCGDSVCRQCGKPIERKRTGRRRLYCSDKCRREWDKNHIPLKKRECIFCGKEFEALHKDQKFCSHDCYIHDRFWREKDAAEIVKLLTAGKKVPLVPKWIKDLLL